MLPLRLVVLWLSTFVHYLIIFSVGNVWHTRRVICDVWVCGSYACDLPDRIPIGIHRAGKFSWTRHSVYQCCIFQYIWWCSHPLALKGWPFINNYMGLRDSQNESIVLSCFGDTILHWASRYLVPGLYVRATGPHMYVNLWPLLSICSPLSPYLSVPSISISSHYYMAYSTGLRFWLVS